MKLKDIKNYIQYLPGCIVILYVILVIISQTASWRIYNFILIGILAAFGATLSWTYACSIWRTQTNIYKPIAFNFLKNIIAFIIFSPVILLLDYSTNY